MLPKVTIDGRLADEPSLRFSPTGKAVARLRMVASDRRKNDASGEWEDGDSLWIDVTCFGKLAENVCESAAKGDLLLVIGKLKTDEWTDRDSSQKRSKITLIADSVGASLQFRQIPHGQSKGRAPAPVQQAYGGDPGSHWQPGEEPPF